MALVSSIGRAEERAELLRSLRAVLGATDDADEGDDNIDVFGPIVVRSSGERRKITGGALGLYTSDGFIADRPSRIMVGGPVVGTLLAVVGVVFIVLGILSWGVCGHGTSLVYMGVAAVLFGAGLAVTGLIAPATVFFLVFIALIVAGLVTTSQAGCPI